MDFIYKTGYALNYLNPLAYIPTTTKIETLAGVSGALAVIACAYAAHALLGLSDCGQPKLSTSLFLAGVGLFSGTCYYTALTDDLRFVNIAPVGGTLLIIAWLSLLM
nr:unnamed protein product [Spirometra erinaceieuropaei]